MTRHFNDPEARAEYSERFGEPEQQGIHETYMRPQPCVDPDRGTVGKLVEMGNLKDGNGDEVIGILIECSKHDLQACDLRMYGDVRISNAKASGPVAEDQDAALLESLTYWPSPEQNNERK